MQPSLSFVFELDRPSWAKGLLTDGRQKVFFQICSTARGISELTEALVAIIFTDKPQARLWWKGESWEYQWDLAVGRSGDVLIELFYRESRDASQELVFGGRYPLRDLVSQVVDACGKLLSTHGLVAYRKHWAGREFPVSDYLRLRAWIDAAAQPTCLADELAMLQALAPAPVEA